MPNPAISAFFTQPFIVGNPQALAQPKSLVLTKSLAEKIFGHARSAMNQSIKIGGRGRFTVKGVVANSPINSHLRPEGFISLDIDKPDPNWGMMGYHTYALLKPGQSIENLNAKMPDFVKRHITPTLPPDIRMTMSLYPITKIHFNAQEQGGTGNINSIYLFSVIALFILLIAAINYTNLATTKSTQRAKEIGIRKVIGLHRFQLVRQFMTEAVLLTLVSLLVSLSLVEVFLPAFNQLAQKTLVLDLSNFRITGTLLSITLFVGLISGLYPAFYLSAFNPVMVLKGKFSRSRKGAFLRKSLVVVQFAVSVVMIIGTLVVYQQMDYVKNKELGFDKDRLLVVPGTLPQVRNKVPVIRQKLLGHPNVQAVSSAALALARGNFNMLYVIKNEANESKKTGIGFNRVDYNYIDVMGMKMVLGRQFSRKMASDSNAVIVNEALVKQQGWKNPIGKKIGYQLDRQTLKPTKFAKVIGVVKNFHTQALYRHIEPYMLWLNTNKQAQNYLFVKVKANDIPKTVAYAKSVWQEVEKAVPFESYFLEQNYLRSYQEDERRGTIFLTFSVLAIFIACMGLFALAAYTVNQRMKEIGVRKVLGASTGHIVKLVTSDFVKLIVLASIIAFPIAWYFMNAWLQDFAYRITIGWHVFAVSGGLALVVALFTVGTQAIKATLVNPVEVLKDE